MQVIGDYHLDGYAHLKGLIAPEIARAFLQGLKQDVGNDAIRLSGVMEYPNLLRRAAFEIYGHHYKPMLHFLWGLTPLISNIVGRDLLPTYDYLRIYREGDVCLVHSDRQSCEHSVSLTLDYSDGAAWGLEIELDPSTPSSKIADDFGGSDYATINMEVGDAVIYRGVDHRHGRILKNPNAWSAHLFLHWVECDGKYIDFAFDGQGQPRRVNFTFS